MNKISLLLICGPPGVGKSTLKTNLKQHISYVDNDSYVCLTISYDEIMDFNLESYLINESEENKYDNETASNSCNSKTKWKEGRCFIFELISTLIKYFKSDSNNLVDFIRINLSHENKSYLKIIYKNFIKCIQDQLQIKRETNYLIIIDDLFYYESMRFTFYRLAINKKCNYFVYFLKASNLNFLLDRNRNRPLSEQLNESIVENIYNKIEWPKDCEKEFSHCELIDEKSCFNISNSFELILAGFKSFSTRLKAINERKALQAENISQSSAKNVIHSSDLIMRKLIGSILFDCKSEEKAINAKKLNKRKGDILDELRLGETNLLSSLCKCDDDILEFENILKSKLLFI